VQSSTALLARSLIHGGLLCLGSKESLLGSGQADAFDEVVSGSRIFRKKIGARWRGTGP
jgi:chemotaxis methyl-accepting protein methylase